MDTEVVTVVVIVTVLALAAGFALGALVGSGVLRRSDDRDRRSIDATAEAVAPVKSSLDRFDDRLRALETSRIEWHAQLREQVESVRQTSESLRRETSSLATALRRPQVRGRWGEMHLQRAVEIAGLVEHCDFDQQTSVRDGDTVLRPDMVVRLAGDKHVVVDSKVPLDAFLDAVEVEDESLQTAHLTRHARQLKTHVDALSAKAYWKQFDRAPEFVVLFVPGEAFLSQALEIDPSLLEYASAKRVILATPTTVIALLRTIAFAWTQDQLAANAREVHTLARELYDRLSTLGGHVDKVGRSLTSAVAAYNSAVASLEGRVLVSARRLSDLDVTSAALEAPRTVEQGVRPLSAAELIDAALAEPEGDDAVIDPALVAPPVDPPSARRAG